MQLTILGERAKMSDKAVKEAKNKSFSRVIKWFFGVLAILVTVAGTIVASVKITETRGQADTTKFQNLLERISIQNARIDALEQLPEVIATTTRQLEATSYSLNTLSDNFNRLAEESGQNKVPSLIKQTADITHRLKTLEEMQNNESLILSVALLIKEKALYHQNFAHEASILAELGKDSSSISQDIETINLYKNQSIADNSELVAQYKEAMDHFSFGNNKNIPSQTADENAAFQGVKLLKNTVLGINFDKVVVLKKEKQTDQQKKLLADLDAVVNSYNFPKALNIIASHPELTAVENKKLNDWQENVKTKLAFDAAISHLIGEQLSSFRKDVSNNAVKQPKIQDVPSPVEDATDTLPNGEAIND